MALYRYFKATDTKLSDSHAESALTVLSTSIVTANGKEQVKRVLQLQQTPNRGPYTRKFTPKQKPEIGLGKRVAEHAA